MFIGEPPSSQADLHFSLFGIPVRIHPWFWIVALFLKVNDLKDPMDVITWVAAVLIAVLIHEFGHALTMRAFGLRPWITLHGFGGLTSYDPRFVAQSKASSAGAQVLISFAGPAAGFLVVGAIVGIAFLTGHGDQVIPAGPGDLIPVIVMKNPNFTLFLFYFFLISILWGIINLLPVYPLDGGQIAREILVAIAPRDGIRWSLMLSIAAGAGMAVFALVQWRSILVPFMFGYLAYSSYQTLIAYSNRTPWR